VSGLIECLSQHKEDQEVVVSLIDAAGTHHEGTVYKVVETADEKAVILYICNIKDI
jgi:EAL domain-containing protein (putative c-di-GMP-specific phosphodiesterase class I)